MPSSCCYALEKLDPSGDLVLISPSSSAINVGEDITLRCEARIGVFKELSWTKDNTTLTIDQGRMNVEQWKDQKLISQLRIQNATSNDAGVYECNAVKEGGERDRESIRLTIKSK